MSIESATSIIAIVLSVFAVLISIYTVVTNRPRLRITVSQDYDAEGPLKHYSHIIIQNYGTQPTTLLHCGLVTIGSVFNKLFSKKVFFQVEELSHHGPNAELPTTLRPGEIYSLKVETGKLEQLILQRLPEQKVFELAIQHSWSENPKGFKVGRDQLTAGGAMAIPQRNSHHDP